MIRRLFTLLLTGFLAAGPAFAQQGGRPPHILALSWSPDYCAHHGSERSARDQCGAKAAFGFIVHGLWAEVLENPAACRPRERPPTAVIERMMPIMPSAGLIEHEWNVHGRCSGLSADDYFDRVARAFLKVQVPDRLQRPDAPVTTDVLHLKRWFQEANPGLLASMMDVQCDPGGTRLKEIRFCMGDALDFRPCGPKAGDQCKGGAVVIAPVR